MTSRADLVAKHRDRFHEAQSTLATMTEEQQVDCCRQWIEEGLKGLAYLRGARAAALVASSYSRALQTTGAVR